LEKEKSRGRTIVLANGCFDLIHVGHIRYLQGARACGDILVVAVNSDKSVRKLKGPGRPLLGQKDRALILSALEMIDYITIFDEETVHRVLLAFEPHVHAKGSDYSVETVPERETVKSYGGKTMIVGGDKVRSTSKVIQDIAG
jgi:D-glycero-beta-D-manno-heptose 1-phosphate adenylyltransferase